jgi:hypothetical protein
MWEVSNTEVFRDDQAARCYLEAALENAPLPPYALLPPRKWVQLLYLTDDGRLNVSAEHLAGFLDVPHDIAIKVMRHLEEMQKGRILGAPSPD